jgi:hypothetical protein
MTKAHQVPAWISSTIIAIFLLLGSSSWAGTMPMLEATGERAEDRQQLRVVLDQMEKAITNLDVEAAIKLMQRDVIVTWQNAEVSRGPEQIRTYYNRMLKGSAPIVKKFSTKATLGGPAAFYSDSAIAYGTSIDTYELMEGLDFSLNANWSTTVVKTDGLWKIAALHFSSNLFDNPLFNNAKRMIWIAAITAFLAGLLLASVVGLLLRKKNDRSA